MKVTVVNRNAARQDSTLVFVCFTVISVLAFNFLVYTTPASADRLLTEPLCGNGSPPDYGFIDNLQQPHWTVNWQSYASEQTVIGVDAVLDQLNADSIAQTMILFKSQTEIGDRVNCAVHFLRYMQLGLPTGERKDNGFVFLIVVEPTRIDVHYGVGLGLPALTASELTDINRTAEDAYQTNHSTDEALLALVEKYDAVARSNYPPLVSPTPTGEAGSDPLLPAAPLGILNICGLLCMGIFFVLFLMWGLRQMGRGGINLNPSGSRSRRMAGNPFGGGSSARPTRGGSGSGRSGRGN